MSARSSLSEMASKRGPTQLILSSLVTPMAEYAQAGAEDLVFVGPTGSALGRSNFDTTVRRRAGVANAGIPGPRFHGLRLTGTTLVAAPYASTRELMSRMGQSSTRAATICLHATEERDRVIADALTAMLVGHVPTADDRGGP